MAEKRRFTIQGPTLGSGLAVSLILCLAKMLGLPISWFWVWFPTWAGTAFIFLVFFGIYAYRFVKDILDFCCGDKDDEDE